MFDDGLFDEMPTLETPRLILRKLDMRDAADMFDYSRDPQVAKHVLWDAHTSISESRGYIRYMIRKNRSGEPSSWGIVEKLSGRVVGTIGYMWYQKDNNSCEIGYSLARACWNRGYMTEALTEVIRYSFENLRLHRVEAQHEVDNGASGAVMRKCGMTKEGTLRGRLYNKGRYVDVDLYSILREDYASRVRAGKNA